MTESLDQARADAARERDELRASMEARIQATEAELARRDREHGAELARIEAAAEARAAALEEARADLRARADRAERELDQRDWHHGASAPDAAPESREVSSGGHARQAGPSCKAHR